MTEYDHSPSRTWADWFLAAFVMLFLLSLSLSHLNYALSPRVSVRWGDQVTQSQREELEATYRLTKPEHEGEQYWSYEIGVVSTDHLRQLVQDPAAAGTGRIDRRRFELDPPPAPLFDFFIRAVLSGVLAGIGAWFFAQYASTRGRRRPGQVATSVTFDYCFVATLGVVASLWMGLAYATYDPTPRISVRWGEHVTESQREALEVTYHLVDPAQEGARTRSYGIKDTSTDNVGQLVQDPGVEDTDGIDRGSFRPDARRAPSVNLLPIMVWSTLVAGVVAWLVTKRPPFVLAMVPSLGPDTPAIVRDAPTVNHDGFNKLYLTLTYVSVFCVYYILFLNQGLIHTGPLGDFPSETRSHMDFARPFLEGRWLDELKTNFEPLLHALTAVLASAFRQVGQTDELLNLANAAALILSLAKLSQFVIVKHIVAQSLPVSLPKVIFLTAAINVCTVLYVPLISLDIYMPMSTPNILIDPTNILLGPLAILFFFLYFKHYMGPDSGTFSWRQSVGLSVLLIAGTLAKPAFTNIILVVVALHYLSHPKRFASRTLSHDLLIYVPSGLLLVWQLLLIRQSSAGGAVVFAPYQVILEFTRHPVMALFQALAFPLLVALARLAPRMPDRPHYLYFAWLFSLVAYLIYALFAFSGGSWDAANLSWSYQIGLTLLYLFSVIEYGRLISSAEAKGRQLSVNVCTLGFCFIVLSGIHQFVKVFLGGDFL